jgi:hypothetical protein
MRFPARPGWSTVPLMLFDFIHETDKPRVRELADEPPAWALSLLIRSFSGRARVSCIVPQTVLDHSADSPAAGEGWKGKERPARNVTPGNIGRRRVQALAR